MVAAGFVGLSDKGRGYTEEVRVKKRSGSEAQQRQRLKLTCPVEQVTTSYHIFGLGPGRRNTGSGPQAKVTAGGGLDRRFSAGANSESRPLPKPGFFGIPSRGYPIIATVIRSDRVHRDIGMNYNMVNTAEDCWLSPWHWGGTEMLNERNGTSHPFRSPGFTFSSKYHSHSRCMLYAVLSGFIPVNHPYQSCFSFREELWTELRGQTRTAAISLKRSLLCHTPHDTAFMVSLHGHPKKSWLSPTMSLIEGWGSEQPQHHLWPSGEVYSQPVCL